MTRVTLKPAAVLIFITATCLLWAALPLTGQWNTEKERLDYLDRINTKWNYRDSKLLFKNGKPVLPGQSFTFKNGQDISVTGRQGTYLYISRSALPATNGGIRVVLYEVLEPIDFFLAAVDLGYGNTILESDGMARYEVYDSNGRPVQTAPSGVRLEIPRRGQNSFYLFKNKNGQWQKQSEQPVIDTAGVNDIKCGADCEGGMSAARLFEGAESFTWLNFDKPVEQVACLQASVSAYKKNVNVTFVGLSARTLTVSYGRGSGFSINAIQNTSGVLVVSAAKGYMATMKLTVPSRDGLVKNGQVEKGSCSQLPALKLVKVPPGINKDREKLRQFLKL